MPVLNDARALGRELFDANSIMARLAMSAARAMIDGEIVLEDAERVYDTYYDATMIRTKAQAPTSHKAQVSKLRQIMKLAEERPRDAVELLERVIKLHSDATLDVQNVKPLYECMVNVARAQLDQPKKLTNGNIIAIMRRD